MALWTKGVERSKHPKATTPAKEEKPDFSDLFEDDDDEIIIAETKEIDWEERHFQICLALISRTDLDSRNPEAIIRRADKMVEALKNRNEAAE